MWHARPGDLFTLHPLHDDGCTSEVLMGMDPLAVRYPQAAEVIARLGVTHGETRMPDALERGVVYRAPRRVDRNG